MAHEVCNLIKHASKHEITIYSLQKIGKDTPKTAGRDGVNGRVKSQTVTLNFMEIEVLVMLSSSIISPDVWSSLHSSNVGSSRSSLNDDAADLALLT